MAFYTQQLNDFQAHSETSEGLREGVILLQQKIEQQEIPFIADMLPPSEIDTLKKYATDYRQNRAFKHVILCGTGGSALGMRAISDWVKQPLQAFAGKMPFLHICDNFDTESFKMLLDSCDPQECLFLFISKSGGTLETISQAYFTKQWLTSKKTSVSLADIAIVITEPKDSALKRFAIQHDLPCFNHSQKIGGRYSVLSMTGILPCFLMGIDAERILLGANTILQGFIHDIDNSEIVNASFLMFQEIDQNTHIHNHVFFGYSDYFSGLTLWIRQLWAESLGKDGKGTTPIPATGSLDQHSQLQLYADGMDDKIYTSFSFQNSFSNDMIFEPVSDAEFSYLSKQSGFSVLSAFYKGTIDSLRAKGRKIRQIECTNNSLEVLGGLFMHMMLETVCHALFMNVNAFDQPAVEDSKNRARAILKKSV